MAVLSLSEHRVGVPFPARYVLHLGRCTCGWRIGYDPRTYMRALLAAQAHVVDAYLAALVEYEPQQ